MKRKGTRIKIKRSKVNLYNKRKNKTRRVVSIVITAVAAVALCIVGYGLGKPILEYLQSRESQSSVSASAWTPPVIESSEPSSEPQSESSETSEDKEPAVAAGSMYFLPDNAALSTASLNSALAAAKSSGNKIAAVTMKSDTGEFLYKTNIKSIKDSEIVTGSLTAAQVCEAITKAGLIPAAKISVLKDPKCGSPTETGFELAGGTGYWLDNRPEKGGKMWLSPFKTQTMQFVGNITSELSAAGFKHIVAVNTTFPVFHNEDIKTYLSDLPLKDNTARAEALWNVLESAKAGAEKNGAMFWVEISGENAVKDAAGRLCTDAEILYDKDRYKSLNIIADYTPSGSPSEAYKEAGDFAKKLSAALEGAEYYVLIKGGFSGTALSDVKKAFSDAGVDTFL